MMWKRPAASLRINVSDLLGSAVAAATPTPPPAPHAQEGNGTSTAKSATVLRLGSKTRKQSYVEFEVILNTNGMRYYHASRVRTRDANTVDCYGVVPK